MPRRSSVTAPSWEEIKDSRKSKDLTLELKLTTVTPILGGGYIARQLDDIDFVRGASLRGQLRFWWRALYGHTFENADDLYKAESAIWGGIGDDARRSAVSIETKVTHPGNNVVGAIPNNISSYALFPARPTPQNQQITAPRREGVGFILKIHVFGNGDLQAQVRNTCSAWVLFGGIGGRTRRGLGTVKPSSETIELLELRSFVGDLENKMLPERRFNFPTLAGATWYKRSCTNAMTAWEKALSWLKTFRQDPGVGREQGDRRPGRSRWPEPDVVRRLAGADKNPQKFAHTPRYRGDICYPRAQFGLPIITRWQTRNAQNQPYRHPEHESEPGKQYEINLDDFDRLASPLIVKAAYLPEEGWQACALWLDRAAPPASVIVKNPLVDKSESKAKIEKMPSNEVLFTPIRNQESVRSAFFAWLREGNR